MIIAALVAIAAAGFVGALRAVTHRLASSHQPVDHEVAGAIFSMIGVLYAVILAFVVIVLWESDSAVRDHTQEEANDVSQIYFTARALPQPQRAQLTGLARDYADIVAHKEWPAMRSGQTSAGARADVAAMRTDIMAMKPADAGQQILMSQTLDAINALVDARRERTSALTPPVPTVMWVALVAGAALTVGFTFLFGYERFGRHLTMVTSMTALLAFILWLTYQMSHPFTGPVAQGPDAFLEVLDRFTEFPAAP